MNLFMNQGSLILKGRIFVILPEEEFMVYIYVKGNVIVAVLFNINRKQQNSSVEEAD